MYLNKVMLIGNLTKDPELKSLPSGVKVTSFSLATNRTWYDANKMKQEAVEFHNIVTFGRQAEIVSQYMTKGSSLYVEGRLQTRSWEQNGEKKYRTEIVAESVQFGPKSAGSASTQSYDKAPSDAFQDGPLDYPEGEINPDDIPF